MIVMAVLNTINMGCALDMSVVKQNIFRPVGPIVGFVSQFTFMPLVRGIIYTVKVTTVYTVKLNVLPLFLGFLWTCYASL